MEEIINSTTKVAEVVETSKNLVHMMKKDTKGYQVNIEFPILFGVVNILEEKQTPRYALTEMMSMIIQIGSFDERGE